MSLDPFSVWVLVAVPGGNQPSYCEFIHHTYPPDSGKTSNGSSQFVSNTPDKLIQRGVGDAWRP